MIRRYVQLLLIMPYAICAMQDQDDVKKRIQRITDNVERIQRHVDNAYYVVDSITQKSFSNRALYSLGEACQWAMQRIDVRQRGKHTAYTYTDPEKRRKMLMLCLGNYEKIVRSTSISTAVEAPIFSKQQLRELRYGSPEVNAYYHFPNELKCGVAISCYPLARARIDIRDAYHSLREHLADNQDTYGVLRHVREQLQNIDVRIIGAKYPDCNAHIKAARDVLATGCRELGVSKSYVIPDAW